jgi:hypothetical protein
MPFRNEIIFLTFLVFILALFASLVFPSDKLSAYGTIFAAAGSLIAVIFFSANLYYQSIQLKEQREQFNTNFLHLREDAKRKAILVTKDLLNDAEKRAVSGLGDIKGISDLPILYAQGLVHWDAILNSENPSEVAAAVKIWMPLENSAKVFTFGVKNAAEVYFKASGISGVDYSKNPEDFIYIYSSLLHEVPYFQAIIGTAEMLVQFMSTAAPGRKACLLAAILSMAITAPPGITREDKIQQDIEEHISSGHPLPAIVNAYRRARQVNE